MNKVVFFAFTILAISSVVSGTCPTFAQSSDFQENGNNLSKPSTNYYYGRYVNNADTVYLGSAYTGCYVEFAGATWGSGYPAPTIDTTTCPGQTTFTLHKWDQIRCNYAVGSLNIVGQNPGAGSDVIFSWQ